MELTSASAAARFAGGRGVRLETPAEDDWVAGEGARHREQHRNVARPERARGCGQDVGHDGDVERQRDMQVTLAGAVGVPGVQDAGADGEDLCVKGVRWVVPSAKNGGGPYVWWYG